MKVTVLTPDQIEVRFSDTATPVTYNRLPEEAPDEFVARAIRKAVEYAERLNAVHDAVRAAIIAAFGGPDADRG